MSIDRLKVLQDQLKSINERYGAGTFEIAGERKVQQIPRISTGIFGLDYATGGGVPVGRVTMFWGDRSSGKSTQALRVIGSTQKTCFGCYQFVTECACEKKDPRPGVVALLDVEGAFDGEWAAAVGVDLDALPISVPEYAEQVVDIGEALIRSKSVDLIVVDSLAAMSPSDELEKSSEEWSQGLAARINNKMFRKWQAAMNEVRRETDTAATVLIINQMRTKIGVFYGDPSCKPGGKGQDFVTSVEVKMSAGKYEFEEAKDKTEAPNTVTLRYKIDKNKTSPAKMEGEFEMAVKDFDKYKKGEIVEDKFVLKKAEDIGLIQKDGTKWKIGDETYPTKKELTEHWIDNADNFRKLKTRLLKTMLGRPV